MMPSVTGLFNNRIRTCKTLSYTVVPAEDYRKDMRQLQAARFPFGKKHLSAYEVTLLAATQGQGI